MTDRGHGKAADDRETAAKQRGSAADERKTAAEKRGIVAAGRASASDERSIASAERASASDGRGSTAGERESAADERESAADERESAADERDVAAAERDTTAQRRELGYARSLLASAPDAMVIFSADGLIKLANAETEKLFGYHRDELIGRHVDMLLPPRYQGRHPGEEAGFFVAPGARATGENLDLWGCRKDGSEFALDLRLSALETEEGVLTAAAIRDVTERRDVEQFRQAVLDNMADGLIVVDSEGLVSYLNIAATAMLGYAEDELRGKPMHESIHYQHADGSGFPAEQGELLQLRLDGRPVRKAEDAFTRKDGAILPIAYSAAPLGNGPSGYGMVVVFRDTTEERAQQTRAQRELNTLSWVGRIRDALDDDRLVLYSQPIVSLSTQAEGRQEVLVRMLGRRGEIIPPGMFLGVAEKYGQIGEIDEWVISQAIHLAASGQIVHANLSGISIGSQDLVPRIERELGEANTESGQCRVRDHRNRAGGRHPGRGSIHSRNRGPGLRRSPRRLWYRLRELHLSPKAPRSHT